MGNLPTKGESPQPSLIRKRVYLTDSVVEAISQLAEENSTSFSIETDKLLINLLLKS